MTWKKPSHLTPGTVWRRFLGRPATDGSETKKYFIRDVTPADVEKCIDLMTTHFLRDEPLCHVLETAADPESVATIQDNWRQFFAQGVALACFAEDTEGNEGDLAAVNICIVKSRGEPEEDVSEVKGDSWRKVLTVLLAAEATCDVHETFSVDAYLTSSGLIVAPEHRGHNIGAEMLKAREALCKALGLHATADVFTSNASQALAIKSGWSLLGEVRYSDMLAKNIDLTACDTKTVKHMGVRFNY